MPRTLTVRRPNSTEVRRLLQGLEADDLTTAQRRRAEVLLLYAQGWNAVEIAASLSLHPNTVYLILHAFDQSGLDVIAQVGRRGASPRLTADQRAMIIQIADQPPYELGLPHGRWSLANLRDYLIRHRVVTAISREHLRRVLKKGDSPPPGGAQTPKPRPSAAGNPGSNPLDLPSPPRQGNLAVFR